MKTTQWQRIFPTIVFICWAVAFGRLLYHKFYQSYLMAAFFPLMVTGLILSGLFAWVLFKKTIQTKISFWSGMVLLVPLFFMMGNQQQSLGSYALEKRLVEFERTGKNGLQITPTPIIPPLGYGEIEVGNQVRIDKVHTIGLLDLAHFSERYLGQEIVVQGMMHHGVRTAPDQWVIFRFVVACCIADAKPIAFAIESTQQDQWVNDEWVEVRGIFSQEDKPGIKRYKIIAKQIKHIETPSVNTQYLYLY